MRYSSTSFRRLPKASLMSPMFELDTAFVVCADTHVELKRCPAKVRKIAAGNIDYHLAAEPITL
ncbi:hypothetical protein AGRA671_23070 [Agrobacterium radiobacter]